MAKGKGSAPAKEASAAKSKKPRFKGINHPKNLDKGFRTHGNKPLIRASLDRMRFRPSAAPSESK